MTATPAVPADANSETLLSHLYAAPGWEYIIGYGKGKHWASTFARTSGPAAGYKIDVPRHDEDPLWLAEVAEVVNGVEQGAVPACGLSRTAIARALAALTAVRREGRTEAVTLTESVALLGVLDPWYGACPEARAVLRALAKGRPLMARSAALLDGLAAHLTRLAEGGGAR